MAKSMLMDAEVLTESIAGYAEESAFCQGQRYYASVIVNTLGCALDELMALADTPIRDRTTLDALALRGRSWRRSQIRKEQTNESNRYRS